MEKCENKLMITIILVCQSTTSCKDELHFMRHGNGGHGPLIPHSTRTLSFVHCKISQDWSQEIRGYWSWILDAFCGVRRTSLTSNFYNQSRNVQKIGK